MQWRSSKVSRSNSEKLDAQATKIDEVHAATTSLVESTGSHRALSE